MPNAVRLARILLPVLLAASAGPAALARSEPPGADVPSSGPAAAADDAAAPLRLGADVWPPFTNREGLSRVAIDLVRAALERVGVAARFEIREDFGRLVRALREGDLDGGVALWRTEERESFLRFSQPYLENRLVLLARKGTDVSASSLSALIGKRVAIVESYAYGEILEQPLGPDFAPGRSDQENVQRLLQGEVDYVLADQLLVHDVFARRGQRAETLLTAGSTPLAVRSLHFALRRTLPDSEEIVERFDAVIRQMVADGSYNRLLGVTWIRADVDGDGRSELLLGGDRAGTREPQGGYEIFDSEEGESGQGRDDRYVVDGQTYERWEDIPPTYRVPARREEDLPRPGIRLFEF